MLLLTIQLVNSQSSQDKKVIQETDAFLDDIAFKRGIGTNDLLIYSTGYYDSFLIEKKSDYTIYYYRKGGFLGKSKITDNTDTQILNRFFSNPIPKPNVPFYSNAKHKESCPASSIYFAHYKNRQRTFQFHLPTKLLCRKKGEPKVKYPLDDELLLCLYKIYADHIINISKKSSQANTPAGPTFESTNIIKSEPDRIYTCCYNPGPGYEIRPTSNFKCPCKKVYYKELVPDINKRINELCGAYGQQTEVHYFEYFTVFAKLVEYSATNSNIAARQELAKLLREDLVNAYATGTITTTQIDRLKRKACQKRLSISKSDVTQLLN